MNISPHGTAPAAQRAAVDAVSALARRVGSRIRRTADRLRRQASDKAGVDVVTAADHLSESLLTAGLAALFPDHRVAAEEGTSLGPADSPWCWHVDPLDGTANFSRAIPYWSLSIGLAYRDEPVLGVVHGPAWGLTVAGGPDIGVVQNGTVALRPLTQPGPPKTWLVATDWPWDLRQRTRTSDLMHRMAPHIRQFKIFGSAALDLAQVATGHVDAYAIHGVFPWDLCAGTALCKALGADIRRWDGSPWDLRHGDICVSRPGMWELLATGLS